MTTKRSDLLAGFHRMVRAERLNALQKACGLSDSEIELLTGARLFPMEVAENLIENVIGVFPLPLGVATNFVIDGVERVIPMAVEETSIIAACSATAKWIAKDGAIRTYAKGRLIIGQVQIPNVRNAKRARQILHERREELIQIGNEYVSGLVRRGGGVQDIAFRELQREDGGVSLVLHVLCDPCDAMGANLINQVCEALKPKIEEWTLEKVGLCILSNLVDTKLVGAEVILRNVDSALGVGIEEASRFAEIDPYRAATHNKGILNGVDPILIATGNDWRAVEAGMHAYASRLGRYQPLSIWRYDGHDLVGRIEAPIVVGTVGGVTKVHPHAQLSLNILQIQHAEDLSRICAAVGLTQNLGALKALASVGIVKGHMQLHAANLAMMAGAEVHEIAEMRRRLAAALATDKSIGVSKAKELLEGLRRQTELHH